MSWKKAVLFVLLICVIIESALLLLLLSVGSDFFLLGVGYVLGSALGDITRNWLIGMVIYFIGKFVYERVSKR